MSVGELPGEVRERLTEGLINELLPAKGGSSGPGVTVPNLAQGTSLDVQLSSPCSVQKRSPQRSRKSSKVRQASAG